MKQGSKALTKRSRRLVGLLMCGGAAVLSAPAQAAEPEAADGVQLAAAGDDIFVLGYREARVGKGATNLPLAIVDTPQSVSIVDDQFIQDFALDDVNQLLNLVTGISVEEVETDRTYYVSRGFDIKSMQVDGVGLPFNWNVVGALDTVFYDRVEVVRGANGLLTGTGNPSGTINYIRKRPSNNFQAVAEMSAGSWGKMRGEGDISVPLTESGSWAARIVGAYQTGDSYLDHYSVDRIAIQGVVEGQIGPATILTFGYSPQDNKARGPMWGALPILDSDGQPIDLPRSASTTQDWTRWDTKSKTAFAEISQGIGEDWEARAVVTYNDYSEPSELFYVFGSPDSATGLGLFGFPAKYHQDSERWLGEVTLTGKYGLFGREHELLVGGSIATAKNLYYAHPAPADDPAWGPLPPIDQFTGFEFGRPDFGPSYVAGDWKDDLKRGFVVSRFNISDPLKLIAGLNYVDARKDGVNFGASMDSKESKFSPYVGLTYALTPGVNLYASYSDIFEPQPELREDGSPLGAARGKSYEAGIKAELFERNLLATLAVFRADQRNYAEIAGVNLETGQTYYEGIKFRSEGFEAELNGRVSEDLSVLAGFTWLKMEDDDGEDARTFVPRKTANVAIRYRAPFIPGLDVGASVKWQSKIHLDTAVGVIRQGDYAVLNLFANYALNEHVSVAVNVNNVTDEKYLASLYWEQAYYAAPANVTGSLRFRF